MKELEKIVDSNGEPLEIVDAEAREDISEIKQSLSDLENVIEQIDGITIYKQILNQDIVSFSAESSMPIMKLVSNISNVSGCTEANIAVTGKNIFGGLELANGFVSAGGTIDSVNKTVSFNHGNSQYNILKNIKLKDNTKYTFILTYSNNGDNNSLSLYYNNSAYRYPINLNNSSNTKTTIIYTTTIAKIDKLILAWYNVATTKIYYEESGLFEGELTTADFENYNGNLYNIPFVDSGGNTLTIYDGSLDLINGVLIDNDNSTTYQLPATPIDTLQGENNIWSDTGFIANIGYLDILNISQSDKKGVAMLIIKLILLCGLITGILTYFGMKFVEWWETTR